jgi:hypothetical protein
MLGQTIMHREGENSGQDRTTAAFNTVLSHARMLHNSVGSLAHEVHLMHLEAKPLKRMQANGYGSGYGTMPVNIETLTRKTYVLQLSEQMMFGMMKERFYHMDARPEPEQQRIIFRGQQLCDDSMTLANYGLTPGCAVYLVLRLGGC